MGTVINRREAGTTGVSEEVLLRDDGRVYVEQTKYVCGGTMSRRAGPYANYDAYEVARLAGRVWCGAGRWE